jgi:hypothetical protein
MATKQENTKAISTAEFDRRFDRGEDMSEHLDWSTMRRPGLEGKRINIDLPNDFLEALDKEAARRGITRQSLIKTWLYERLHRDEASYAIYAETLATLYASVKSKDKMPGGTAAKLTDVVARLKSRYEPQTVTDILAELSKAGFRFGGTGSRRLKLSERKHD